MQVNTVIPNITLGQLKRLSLEKRATLMHYLSLRGEIYISGLTKLAYIRNECCVKNIEGKTVLAVNVIDSYYDEEEGRIVFVTDLVAKDDGQSIVNDFYLSDISEMKKTKGKRHYRKSYSSDHVSVRTSFEPPSATRH